MIEISTFQQLQETKAGAKTYGLMRGNFNEKSKQSYPPQVIMKEGGDWRKLKECDLCLPQPLLSEQL